MRVLVVDDDKSIRAVIRAAMDGTDVLEHRLVQVKIAAIGCNAGIPGNDRNARFHCGLPVTDTEPLAAELDGSRNYAGIQDPVVDALIDRIITAESREDLIAATRALDRVLLWGHYVVPHWHSRDTRVAYWDKFARPDVLPKYGLDLFAWWVAEDKVAELRGAYETWRNEYWVPYTINRDFASHFHAPLWRRVLLRLTARLHGWLLKPRHVEEGPERVVQLAPH